jgi:superfamily II DNA or RNA helicase
MTPDNSVPNPTTNMSFRWSWRPYQERVLAAVDGHLKDGKVHIVAAPGAGKTTLGLEIFRQLGQPALALSPTRTIHDQWLQHLIDFFPEGSEERPDWVSDDLERPGFFTSITYQALHTSYRREVQDDGAEEKIEDELERLEKGPSNSEIKRLVGQMQAAGIKTLILDEAHHLRSEWWKALTGLLADLPDVILVALTATPPYDVTGREWGRYQELCGPIDEEVSVPELVHVGTLCPHQDFVYTVKPIEKDLQMLWAHHQAVGQVTADLKVDPAFLAAVQAHPMISNPEIDPARVFDAPETAVALLVFLKDRQQPLPRHLLRLLGVHAQDLPDLSRCWWQVLVAGYTCSMPVGS